MMAAVYHTPVLLEESLGLLLTHAGGTVVDCTFGGGGHSRTILERLSEKGQLLAFDQDPDAQANLPHDSRLRFFARNFSELAATLAESGFGQVDGILADLGVSSHQFDAPERGFSFRYDAPLDMRMNPEEGQSATELLELATERELLHIFRTYGELSHAHRLVKAIVTRRRGEPIATTGAFRTLVQEVYGLQRGGDLLPQAFQALRIAVNGELDVLAGLLEQSAAVLKPGGRLVIISYHSLEDRLVKNYLRSGNLQGEQRTDLFGNPLTPWRVLTSKPIMPDAVEMERNPRARSARLRAAEFVGLPSNDGQLFPA